MNLNNHELVILIWALDEHKAHLEKCIGAALTSSEAFLLKSGVHETEELRTKVQKALDNAANL